MIDYQQDQEPSDTSENDADILEDRGHHPEYCVKGEGQHHVAKCPFAPRFSRKDYPKSLYIFFRSSARRS